MVTVLKNSWALLFGILLLMLGNGLHGTLLGVRGGLEGFSANAMAWVMTGYFIGFLGGSRLAPWLIRRVGHVRVFAALASLISACLVLYAAYPNPVFWLLLRIVVGFCFSGVYVVAESWLNDSATNETRGQTISAYIIVQMVGLVGAQMILNLADPRGYALFILISVLVSVAITPILLSINPAPVFQTTKPVTPVQAVQGLAAWRCRDLPSGRRVRGALRDGVRLRHRTGAERTRHIDLRGDHIPWRADHAVSGRLAFRQDGPQAPDRLPGGRRHGRGRHRARPV